MQVRFWEEASYLFFWFVLQFALLKRASSFIMWSHVGWIRTLPSLYPANVQGHIPIGSPLTQLGMELILNVLRYIVSYLTLLIRAEHVLPDAILTRTPSNDFCNSSSHWHARWRQSLQYQHTMKISITAENRLGTGSQLRCRSRYFGEQWSILSIIRCSLRLFDLLWCELGMGMSLFSDIMLARNGKQVDHRVCR